MMDVLSAFGLFSVTAMLAFYALEPRGPAFTLAFALACALVSLYGFLVAPGLSGSSKRFGVWWR
jgi:hypothetical protein